MTREGDGGRRAGRVGSGGADTLPLERLRGGLVVSCQPVPGGPMDRTDIVVALACAAEAGGARGLRVAGAENVRAVRDATTLSLIGLVKRPIAGRERITPERRDVEALLEAGADVIAFDATRRPRPATVLELVAAIHAGGQLAMADCADVEDGREALAAGADVLGSTLSGYLDNVVSGRLEDAVPIGPDLALVRALRTLSAHVLAEGRYNTPALAAEAMRCGAWAVVVGSAITRAEHVTSWFADAVRGGAAGSPSTARDEDDADDGDARR